MDAIDLEKLRWTMSNTLHSPACRAIRFRVDNVAIQTYMYSYIGDAITNRLIQVDPTGTGRTYDPASNVLTVDSLHVPPAVIVHEATHAAINATHQGKRITTGTHATT